MEWNSFIFSVEYRSVKKHMIAVQSKEERWSNSLTDMFIVMRVLRVAFDTAT